MQNLVTNACTPTGWTVGNATLTADGVVLSPAGLPTMRLTEDSANAAHLAYPGFTVVQGRIHTFAMLAKKSASSRDWFVLAHNGGGTNRAWFNISTGVVGSKDTSVIDRGIEPAGDGFYLIWISFLQTTAFQPICYPTTGDGAVAYLGDGVSYTLITHAQLTETRGPAAFVNAIGNAIKGRTRRRAPRQNLLFYSEDFTQATWFKESAAVTVTGNSGTAPDGTLTADRLQWTSGALRYVGQTLTFQARTHNLCVWVKSNNGSSQKIRLRLPSVVGVSNQDSADIVVSTSWQRVMLTVNCANGGSSTFLIESDTLNSAVDILIWGAQLSHCNGMPTYVPTTNLVVDEGAPRSIPERSQILFDTENLAAGSWTAIGSPTLTLLAGQGLGGYNATRLDDQSAAEYRGVYQARACPADWRAYTFSVDVAKTSTTPSFGINFTLLGGTVVSMTPRLRPSDGAFAQAWFTSSAWAYVEDLGTHWRVHCTLHNNGTNTSVQVNLYAAAGAVYTADSVTGVGYADVGRVSLTATKGPVEYIANDNSGGISFPSTVGNARGRRTKQNLLQISNFNNAAWNVGNATRSVGVTLPGGRPSIKLTEDTSNGAHYTDQTTVPLLLPGRRYTVGVTFQVGSPGRPWCVIGANGGGVSGWLNALTGQIQNPSPGCQMRARRLDATTWRAWFTFTADASSVFRFYLAATYGAAVYVGDGTSFGYYGDVTLTEGNGEAEFAESTRAIQGAVNEGLGGPRSIIGRQNTIVSPSDFGGAAWSRSQATIDPVALLAPDGTLTAKKLIDNANNSLHYVTQACLDPLNFNGTTFARAGLRTWHVYAKADTLSGLVIAADNTNQGAYFDLALGRVALPFTVPGGFAECRPAPNGFWKCSFTTDVSVSGSLNLVIGTSPDPYAPIGAYVGSGQGIIIWGAGLSAGGGQTAEQLDIPVVGSQVTDGYPRHLIL